MFALQRREGDGILSGFNGFWDSRAFITRVLRILRYGLAWKEG